MSKKPSPIKIYINGTLYTHNTYLSCEDLFIDKDIKTPVISITEYCIKVDDAKQDGNLAYVKELKDYLNESEEEYTVSHFCFMKEHVEAAEKELIDGFRLMFEN